MDDEDIIIPLDKVELDYIKDGKLVAATIHLRNRLDIGLREAHKRVFGYYS